MNWLNNWYNFLTVIYIFTAGAKVKVYDVAVNSKFFDRCQSDELFQTFIISLTIEGVAEKFKIEISSESID